MMPDESRTRLAAHISEGKVLVDGVVRKPGMKVEPGQIVRVEGLTAKAAHDLIPVEVAFEVVFEDEYLMVINKPAGLSVHPAASSKSATLVHGLLHRSSELSKAGGDYRPGIVHRLDKDTSGLLVIAKTDSIHRSLQRAIQERAVSREYLAWVKGVPDQIEFTIRAHIGRHPKNRQKMAVVSRSASDAREATTHCRLIERLDGGVSLIACRLDTGRTHQIRVHLGSLGLPLLGDPMYGVPYAGLERQALHAYRLSFVHPITKEKLEFTAKLPEDLSKIFSWDSRSESFANL